MIEEIVTENEYGKGVVKSWASIIDDATRAQAAKISRVPILEGYLALMPDAHFGYGPPVGSALKTRRAVMPYAVGVDIGCGMIAVETDLDRDKFRGIEGAILGHIRELIPSGVGTSHKQPLPQAQRFIADNGFPAGLSEEIFAKQAADMRQRARIQFGTLGAGNHFVEVCEDDHGVIWLLLHSGSRGVGNLLATGHVSIAQTFCEQNGLPLEHWEFSYFPAETVEAEIYLGDMLWAQRYAYAQREAMMDGLMEAVSREIGPDWNEVQRINCHHNYAEQIEDGTWITRKGAIDAGEGKMGIIPGSMGAATYIVRGKGNEEAYNTSPHGAGRILGRNQARKTLDEKAFREQMVGKTWLDRDAKKLLDEAPSAYKPIEQVIADSEDLIEPVTVMSQFINYKGL
ncbi:MAG TPA: RtcB family protein [Dehalococcoidia bacterium]|nr:RtcB family protein [Dehalococcoidia bacterium]